MWLRGLHDRDPRRKRRFDTRSFQDSSDVWASLAREDRTHSPSKPRSCRESWIVASGLGRKRMAHVSSRDSSPFRECLQSLEASRRTRSVSPQAHYTLEDTRQLGRRAGCCGQNSAAAKDCLFADMPADFAEAWAADRKVRATAELEISLGARRVARPRSRHASRSMSSDSARACLRDVPATSEADFLNRDSQQTRELEIALGAARVVRHAGVARNRSAGMKEALRYVDDASQSQDAKIASPQGVTHGSEFALERERDRFGWSRRSAPLPHALRHDFSDLGTRLARIRCLDTEGSEAYAGRPSHLGPMGHSRCGWGIAMDNGAAPSRPGRESISWEGRAGRSSQKWPVENYSIGWGMDSRSRSPSRGCSEENIKFEARETSHARNFYTSAIGTSDRGPHQPEPKFSGPRLGPPSRCGHEGVSPSSRGTSKQLAISKAPTPSRSIHGRISTDGGKNVVGPITPRQSVIAKTSHGHLSSATKTKRQDSPLTPRSGATGRNEERRTPTPQRDGSKLYRRTNLYA